MYNIGWKTPGVFPAQYRLAETMSYPHIKHHLWTLCVVVGASSCAFGAHFFRVVGAPVLVSLWSLGFRSEASCLLPPLSSGAHHSSLMSFICMTCYSTLPLLAHAGSPNIGWIKLQFPWLGVPFSVFSCTMHSGLFMTRGKNLTRVQASRCCSDILPDSLWASQ